MDNNNNNITFEAPQTATDKVQQFVDNERRMVALDVRTLNDVEAVLLYRPDGWDEYWDDCDVDIFEALTSVRSLKKRLLDLADGFCQLDRCLEMMKGGAQ